jgi:hypothetical protein
MRTKKRTVRRKRSYKKSNRSYKSKRGGATAPITFNIVKGNGLYPLFEVELSPSQTGNDLYNRVNQWLDQHPDYLTADEKAGEQKLVTDNATEVTTDVSLSAFQSPTTIILSINLRGAGTAELEERLAALSGGNRNRNPKSRTFTIVKSNSDDPVFKIKLRPNQSGKDLYDEVTRRLDRNLAYYLTDAERAGQRKLVTDNDVIVKYADNLSMFQPRTKLILSIIPEGSSNAHGRGLWLGRAPRPVPPAAGA